MIVIKCLMIWFIVIEASSEEIRSTSELSISNAKSTSTPVTLPPPPPQVGGPPPPPGLTGPPPPGITGGPTPPPPLTSGSAPADLVPGYKQLRRKRCSPRSFLQKYRNAVDARIACDNNRHCRAIYNLACKAKGYYDLCFEDEIMNISNNDYCIYQKETCKMNKECPKDKLCINHICSVPCDDALCNDNGHCYLDYHGNKTCSCDFEHSGSDCRFLNHYVKLDNKWCEPQIEETKNDWLSAKVACDNDRHCKMFYDVKSANKTFVLCGAFPITRTSEFLESTAYTKCEGRIISGINIGKSCFFPFEYNGVKYDKCTTKDSTGYPWCSTNSNYSESGWGYCTCRFEWPTQKGERCYPKWGITLEKFSTLEEAKEMCAIDESCHKISDYHCDKNKNEEYFLCKTNNFDIMRDQYGCTYAKPGVYTNANLSKTTDMGKDETETTPIPQLSREHEARTLNPKKSGFSCYMIILIASGFFIVTIIILMLYFHTQDIGQAKSLHLSFKISFKLVCLLLAIYMTADLIERYIENNDSSVISYKQFNEHKGDMYPTFSFCITENPYFIYNDALKELHLSKKEYEKALEGLVPDSPEKQKMWDRIITVNPERFIISLNTFIFDVKYKTHGKNGSLSYHRYSDGIDALKKLFYLSHHDPDRICFTRASPMNVDLNEKRKEDEIKFDFTPLNYLSTFNATHRRMGNFRVYIHYPNQLIRSLRKPTYHISLKWLGKRMVNGKDVSLTVSYVSILRKRHDANIRCNASLIDDDLEFKMRVIKKIGCIPVYWKDLIKQEMKIKPCNNVHQYQQTYSYIKDTSYTNFMSTYRQPCIELMTPINSEEKSLQKSGYQGFLFLKIPYTTDTFQEIQNVKDFGFETLWSSAGGFIGIFLGYSLLQLPELFEIDWKQYWKKMLQCAFPTKLLLFLMSYFDGQGQGRDGDHINRRVANRNLSQEIVQTVNQSKNMVHSKVENDENSDDDKVFIAQYNKCSIDLRMKIANIERQTEKILWKMNK